MTDDGQESINNLRQVVWSQAFTTSRASGGGQRACSREFTSASSSVCPTMASPMHPIRPSQILGLSLVGLSIGTRDSALCFSPKKDFSSRASSPSPSPLPPPPPPPSPSQSPSPSENGVRQQQHSSGRRWKNRCDDAYIFFSCLFDRIVSVCFVRVCSRVPVYVVRWSFGRN